MENNRYFIKVHGIVQGVGFRPFVYRLARDYGLSGTVRNTSGQVEIEVEGPVKSLDRFNHSLIKKAPPAARIETITCDEIPATGQAGFTILESRSHRDEYQPVSPDLATCHSCTREIFDQGDRRFGYAFTNCTNCGPRFTIIKDIPYDRPMTTMAEFVMCPDCRREYDDPSNRRFHAQPNACPVCGPALELKDRDGNKIEGDALKNAASLIIEGNILAIKGLGGYLLAADASNHTAVCTLRQRKHRPAKPFAVMVKNLPAARNLCIVNSNESRLLASTTSPIVLLRKRSGAGLSEHVAPGLKFLGLMLPYTPLHHLLMEAAGVPLVMTSGNVSEEPIARDNGEAFSRLNKIADYFLMHNRDIHSRYDDSVTMYAGGSERVLRRARGYAPVPVNLPFSFQPVLGVGADMKATFCLTRGRHAFLSQHIGDLDNSQAMEHYLDTLAQYQRLFRIEPTIIAHDMHPDYSSTRLAVELKRKHFAASLVPVQHHHAHIASVLLERNEPGPVIGVALDGTGYGTDGAIWGGEFMLADCTGFERQAHLEYLPLPGGDGAIRNPYRIATSYAYNLLGGEVLDHPALQRLISEDELAILIRQLERRINTPLTSSCGRLFDAVAALIGLRRSIEYEAQAAIDLEMAVTGRSDADQYAYPLEITNRDGSLIIGLKPLLSAILKDIDLGKPAGKIALRFHLWLIEVVQDICQRLSRQTGVNKIALSGGVFQNRLFLVELIKRLEGNGFRVLTHDQIPPNDGCISLGQVAVAQFSREK